jgi:hypothetical protein
MLQYDEYLQAFANVERLGFSLNEPKYIPIEYLENKTFIIFRTCHSYGDWVILSAMPRLLKQKYPDCTVIIPSPECIRKFFSPDNWMNKHENPFNNVIEIFKNNPWVDGMIDSIPYGYPIYHDHFRLYDENNPDVPLIQQMLKFWRFEEHEINDCEPELYWTPEEITQGDIIIKNLFSSDNFGFLYIDDSFFYSIGMEEFEIQRRRDLIQKEIYNHDLPWLYFSASDNFRYHSKNKVIDIKQIQMTLRIQNYIKSKSKIIIGHQGGYGTDCMSRYTQCYVVPLTTNGLNEHIQMKTTYLC